MTCFHGQHFQYLISISWSSWCTSRPLASIVLGCGKTDQVPKSRRASAPEMSEASKRMPTYEKKVQHGAKGKAKRRHNETIQPYTEYFWILLICFFRARHEHIQPSDTMSVLGARTGSLLASGITLCSSARSFGPLEPNIWKTWCACEGASLVATLVVVSQGSSVAYRL